MRNSLTIRPRCGYPALYKEIQALCGMILVQQNIACIKRWTHLGHIKYCMYPILTPIFTWTTSCLRYGGYENGIIEFWPKLLVLLPNLTSAHWTIPRGFANIIFQWIHKTSLIWTDKIRSFNNRTCNSSNYTEEKVP